MVYTQALNNLTFFDFVNIKDKYMEIIYIFYIYMRERERAKGWLYFFYLWIMSHKQIRLFVSSALKKRSMQYTPLKYMRSLNTKSNKSNFFKPRKLDVQKCFFCSCSIMVSMSANDSEDQGSILCRLKNGICYLLAKQYYEVRIKDTRSNPDEGDVLPYILSSS